CRSMNRQTMTFGAAGCLAIAASSIASRAAGTIPAPVQAAPAQVQATTTAGSGTDLFIRPETQRTRRGAQLLDEDFQTATGGAAKDSAPTIDVVVATLPDPLDSHLDYEFDSELAAIRQAFETSGYVIDRFWLPWPIDREKTDLAAKNNRIDTIAYRRSN